MAPGFTRRVVLAEIESGRQLFLAHAAFFEDLPDGFVQTSESLPELLFIADSSLGLHRYIEPYEPAMALNGQRLRALEETGCPIPKLPYSYVLHVLLSSVWPLVTTLYPRLLAQGREVLPHDGLDYVHVHVKKTRE